MEWGLGEAVGNVPDGTGDPASTPGIGGVRVTDSGGRTCLSQISRVDQQTHTARVYFSFLAEDVPSVGYQTYFVEPLVAQDPVLTTDLRIDENVLENGLVRIELERGRIVRVIWKATGRDTVRQDGVGCGELLLLEDLCNDTELSPFQNKEITDRTFDHEVTDVQVLARGPLRATLQVSGQLNESSYAKRISLTEGSAVVSFETSVEWREAMDRSLRINFPIALRDARVAYSAPYTAVEMGEDELGEWSRKLDERYVHRWATAWEEDFGVTFLTESLSNVLSPDRFQSVLLRNARSCGTIHYENLKHGTHSFRQALLLHDGDWRGARCYQHGWEFATPMYTSQMNGIAPLRPIGPGNPIRDGSRQLPLSASYFLVSDPNLLLTTVRKARDGEGFLARLVEMEGRAGEATIGARWPIDAAFDTNLLEENEGQLTMDGQSFALKYAPHGIHSVRLKFASGVAGASTDGN